MAYGELARLTILLSSGNSSLNSRVTSNYFSVQIFSSERSLCSSLRIEPAARWQDRLQWKSP